MRGVIGIDVADPSQRKRRPFEVVREQPVLRLDVADVARDLQLVSREQFVWPVVSAGRPLCGVAAIVKADAGSRSEAAGRARATCGESASVRRAWEERADRN